MNYRTHSRSRRLNQRIFNAVNRITFHFLHLSWSERLIFFGAAIVFSGLFFEWFRTLDPAISYNAFSLAAGYIGYTVTLLLSILLFLLLSNKNKERLKSKMRWGFSDNAVFSGVGACVLLLAFSIFHSIRGYSTYLTQVEIGNAVAIVLTGGIVILAGTALKYRAEKRELMKRTYVEHVQGDTGALEEYRALLDAKSGDERRGKKESNMSLPV